MKTSKEIIKQAERDLREQFEKIDDIRDYNQEKVLNAFVVKTKLIIFFLYK